MESKTKYKLNCWVKVESEENQELLSKEEVGKELEQQELLFPENKYEIEEVKENKKEENKEGEFSI